MCYVYAVVVFYCHSRSLIAMRFLFRAQDHNMTNGDFAFFTLHVLRTSSTDQPWNEYVVDPEDRSYRRRAFYAVKQVRPIHSYLPSIFYS